MCTLPWTVSPVPVRPSHFFPFFFRRLGARSCWSLLLRSCAHFILQPLPFLSYDAHVRSAPLSFYHDHNSLLIRLVKMKFSAALLTAVLAAVSLVSAVPLERRAGTGTKKAMGKTKLDASGAVYCKHIMYSSVCASTH